MTFDLKKLAKLSCIELSPEEEREVGQDLEKILAAFSQIQEAPLSAADEPMFSPLPSGIGTRPDKEGEVFPIDDFLSNSPDAVGRLFRVPPAVSH